MREEFRPRIKERFDGWVEVGSVMPGGASVLLRVYIKILGLMPFFRAGDVVDEIISRYVPPTFSSLVEIVSLIDWYLFSFCCIKFTVLSSPLSGVPGLLNCVLMLSSRVEFRTTHSGAITCVYLPVLHSQFKIFTLSNSLGTI